MQYRYGRRKEFQIAEFLERRGWDWKIARGSRGPIDLLIRRGRQQIAIQVKATRAESISSSRLGPAEEQRFRRAAARRGARPVVALAVRNEVWFEGVPDGRTLLTGKLRRLHYEYRPW